MRDDRIIKGPGPVTKFEVSHHSTLNGRPLHLQNPIPDCWKLELSGAIGLGNPQLKPGVFTPRSHLFLFSHFLRRLRHLLRPKYNCVPTGNAHITTLLCRVQLYRDLLTHLAIRQCWNLGRRPKTCCTAMESQRAPRSPLVPAGFESPTTTGFDTPIEADVSQSRRFLEAIADLIAQ